jgi:hypothetical protein
MKTSNPDWFSRPKWGPITDPGPEMWIRSLDVDPAPYIVNLLDKVKMAQIEIRKLEMQVKDLENYKERIEAQIEYLTLQKNMLKEEHNL